MAKNNGTKFNVVTFDEAVSFAKLVIDAKLKSAQRFLITIHTLHDGRIQHSFQYHDWPNGDWGACMIATALEAKKAEMSPTSKDRA